MKNTSGTSIYIHIRDELAEQIRTGQLPPGARMPSERELSQRMGVARMTAREALTLLLGEGLIYREGRRGYFVAETRLRTDPNHHVYLFRLIEEAGRIPSAESTPVKSVKATASLARLFQCPVGVELLTQSSVSSMNGRRVCFEQSYLMGDVFEGFSDLEFYDPITEFIRNEFGIELELSGFRARATRLHGEVSISLTVANGTPGLFLTRLYSWQGGVVKVDREFWISDVLEIVVGDFPA